MSVYVCEWCGVTVSANKAFKGHKGKTPIWLHRSCNNTISALNELGKRIAGIEARLASQRVFGVDLVAPGGDHTVEVPIDIIKKEEEHA